VINKIIGTTTMHECTVAMATPGGTRIEKSVTRGRQNNTSHACQRLSQYESADSDVRKALVRALT
jgi:hypothetical protein